MTWQVWVILHVGAQFDHGHFWHFGWGQKLLFQDTRFDMFSNSMPLTSTKVLKGHEHNLKKTKVFTVLLKTIQHRMLNSDWDQVPGKHRFSPQWLWDFFMWDHGKAINCQVGIGLWVGEKVRSQNLQVHLILRNQCWNCWKSKPFMKENCPLLILIVQGSIIQV